MFALYVPGSALKLRPKSAQYVVNLVPVLFSGIQITFTKYLDQVYNMLGLDINHCLQHDSTNCEKGLYNTQN